MTINRYVDERRRVAAEQIRTGRIGIEAEQEMRIRIFEEYKKINDRIKKSTAGRSKSLELIMDRAADQDIIQQLLSTVYSMTGDAAWYAQCKKNYERE